MFGEKSQLQIENLFSMNPQQIEEISLKQLQSSRNHYIPKKYKCCQGASNTAQKMKFPADLVTFNEEILNRKLHFLCSVRTNFQHCLRKASFYIVMTYSKKMNSRIEPCRITPFRIPGRENLI